LDPFETLLVNSAGDEASTRTALEAAGTAFTERPALQVGCFGDLAAQEDDIRALHPRAIGP